MKKSEYLTKLCQADLTDQAKERLIREDIPELLELNRMAFDALKLALTHLVEDGDDLAPPRVMNQITDAITKMTAWENGDTE